MKHKDSVTSIARAPARSRAKVAKIDPAPVKPRSLAIVCPIVVVVVAVAGAAPIQARLGFRGSSWPSRGVAPRLVSPTLMASKAASIWNHPAGPKTIHFWAPTFKWGISIANVADFQKPPEKISYPQQMAVTATGLIWSRYSMVITPKNWNLFSVNVAMATTGLYQLSRKIHQDYMAVPEAPLKKVADA